MADLPEAEHSSPQRSNKGRPRGAASWPIQARALAEKLQDTFERGAENSMRVTNNTKDIDNLINRALTYIPEDSPAQEPLRKVIAKTSAIRHDEADTFLWMVEMAKRLALALVGKYD